jgi:hypothetical protein
LGKLLPQEIKGLSCNINETWLAGLKISKYLAEPATHPRRAPNPMPTFYKFGKLWDIPPAAARLGASLPANKRTDLEPMLSAFIAAHPRHPANPDMPAIRHAIKEFMEEGPISNPLVERWKATYNPAKKVKYSSWFLSTIIHFLDKLDSSSLAPPPIELKPWVFIVDARKTSIDPFPPPADRAFIARIRRQTRPQVPGLECRRSRRPRGTGGAERRGTPNTPAPRDMGTFICVS